MHFFVTSGGVVVLRSEAVFGVGEVGLIKSIFGGKFRLVHV